ncbi:PEP-CTERM sorting domain-containing protein [Plasticicumulans sp.]|uniref:PEP-CTERM sorting domain-containing protein n=1 Tax=Plasticicumulans sp. TaxID=2307179 RepID=UPI00395C3F98
MKHFARALALAGLLGLNASAQAALVPVDIDNFNAADQFVTDDTLNGMPASDGPVALPSSNGVATSRTLAINVLAYNAAPTNSAIVDSGASLLDVINETGEDSEVTVSWVIPSNLIPPGAFGSFFRIAVLQSDGNPLTVEFLLNSASLGSFVVPGHTTNQDLLFTASAAQINAGGTLQMIINGEAGWDADFGSVGLAYNTTPPTTTPEPVSLALFGAGLIGMRRLRRRFTVA